MIDTKSITHLTSKIALTTVEKSISATTINSSLKELDSAPAIDGATFSTLSSQLSSSAARAQARDSSLDLKNLGALAKNISDKVAGNSYYANRKLHDAEIPDTDDPVLLERARQATSFSNGAGKNPFAGLSQDQLRLVMYGESGDFTINERSAASSENHVQQENWNRAMCKRYTDEYNETGKSTQTLVMLLAHYNQLPPIEKAQYPANYAALITSDDSSAMNIFNARKSQSDIQEA
ncbi:MULTISPECIES: hypothetical protein [Pseudomonas syringae group]|uniref:Type III effector n=5 Tax=Pseudomonas syringae group TaxID=136849 RepID=A0AAW4E0H9_PSESX|nr:MULTISPECIES: hypothetical protein [Pseudomonas syringae group]KUR42445.1 hypothetical protein PST407_05532 [Pseudomonas syringae pv. tomato]KUR45827.1 hypothetical protein PSTA9_02294 [Pseudomonas syringae pv. tomato]MBI6699717.1 hypothetical protein [Pseudomonas syringae]MBI6715188.1 hypothetical protein [Pseudomonas syringae]MBI6844464.1 hypothetical protein [Pseudomonas syringae]